MFQSHSGCVWYGPVERGSVVCLVLDNQGTTYKQLTDCDTPFTCESLKNSGLSLTIFEY